MLKVDHFNVGHGDMSLVEFPDGQFMLVDCNVGSDSDAIDALKERIPEIDGGRAIQVLVVTHPDGDHITGLGELVDNGFTFEAVWESGFRFEDDEGRPEYQSLLELIDYLGGSTKLKARREPYAFGDADIYCFCDCDTTSCDEDVHQNGLVIKVEYAGRSVLFMGDADLAASRDKIVPRFGPSGDDTNENLLASDYLHASHHGSRSFFKDSKDDEPYKSALELIAPDVTIISSLSREDSEDYGADGQDWPPHDDAIDLYKQYCTEVLLTGEDGTVSIEITDDGAIDRSLSEHGVEARAGYRRGAKSPRVPNRRPLPAVVPITGPKPWCRPAT